MTMTPDPFDGLSVPERFALLDAILTDPVRRAAYRREQDASILAEYGEVWVASHAAMLDEEWKMSMALLGYPD
jgi:hypothetical protein